MSNGTTSLHRPDEGRWLAGVAAGLGLRFGVPVWIIRIAFALLCFAGGLGALLYLAGWLLIPREGETDAIVQGWLSTGQARQWIGVVLVGFAVIILASAIGPIRGDLAFAVVLIGIGVMLYRGDLSRGDRRQDSTPSPAQAGAPPSAPASAPSSAQAMAPGTESEPPVDAPPVPPVRTPAPARETSFLGRVSVGLAVLALGVLGLFDSVVPGFHPQFRHYVALLVAVIGLGLVIGAWFGRPGGLIVLGLLLIPFLVLSPLAELVDPRTSLDFDFSSTERSHYRPTSVDEIPEEYEMGIGSLLVDLRDVDFAGRSVVMEAKVGIGEVLVRLPDGVAAEVVGEVGIGALQVGDLERGGVGVEGVYRLEGSGGLLLLDAGVGIGQIVVNSWPVDNLPVYRIGDGADLRDAYMLANGSLRLDLGELVLEEDKSVRIDVGQGEVWVTVPQNLGLRITGRVDRGRLDVLGEGENGSNLFVAKHTTHLVGAPRLTLDIRVGEGNVIVVEKDR